MTTIVAVIEEGVGTWIGADSLVTSGHQRAGQCDKWVRGKGFAIGVSGHLFTIDLLRHSVRSFRANMDAHEVWDTVQRLSFKAGHMASNKEGDPSWRDIGMVWATKKHVWSYSGSGGACVFKAGILASVGSGSNYAEGAWVALEGVGLEYKPRLLRCLKAALSWDTASGGPIFLERL